MDCNDNATETDDDPADRVTMSTKKMWKDLSPTHSPHSSPKHGTKDPKPSSMSFQLATLASTSNEPIKSQSLPWNVDNKSSLCGDVDQQANVRGSEGDNNPCSNTALLTWKDLSPMHHSRGNTVDAADDAGEHEAPSSGDSIDSDKIVLAWSGKLPDSVVNHGQGGQLTTWKQVSPMRVAKDPFGFSSPDSSDSDTVRHFSPNRQSSVRPMQESSSDASGGSPTHGAHSFGTGSDGSTYLPSPEDGFSNDYFYDEDFTVQFDTNLKDSLLDAAPSEGVSSASILEFSDTMTIEINEASSTLDSSLHPSHYESELSASEHNSAEMSTSDREMMCSSDMLQISDGPLFTPTPTHDGPSHNISTDSLDKGARAMINSTSASDAGKITVDCGTKKELYMLSFFNPKGKQNTSMASVLSQGSWSSEQHESASLSNCTSQDEMEGSNSSLQHVAYGRGAGSRRQPNLPCQGREPTRSRSSSSAMNLKQLSEATSSESMDGACSERQARLTSWRNVKQRRKQGTSETGGCASRTKSMPELHMQTCLDKMLQREPTRQATQTDSVSTEDGAHGHHSGELRLSGESLMEIYQKTRSLSDHSLAGDATTISDQNSMTVQSQSTTSISESLNKLTMAAANVQWQNIHQSFDPDAKHDGSFTVLPTANREAVAGEYQSHTIPRMYKRSLSSPARCMHECKDYVYHSWSVHEKNTQFPPQFYAEPVALWKGTKNFSAQFPPNTRDCGIQTSTNYHKYQNLTDKEMQTSPDKSCAHHFPCEVHSPQKAGSSQERSTTAHHSRGVTRGRSMETLIDHPHCAARPHSIGHIPVGRGDDEEDEEEQRFPPYDAMVSRCLSRSNRGSSLSPVRPIKQSFYSHRSLPDLSFLTSKSSPISSPVHSPSSAPSTSFKQPVFFTPRVKDPSGHCGSPNHHSKPPPHQYPCHPRAQHGWKPETGTLEGLDIEMASRIPRHLRGTRSEPCKRVGPNQSASSSSGFSTSTTSSGIDPGYHDSRHSPPMAEQFPAACQVWDNRHKFIETDGGCVYYHSLPNNLPPGFITEDEKLDYYACMCVKPTVQEAKMYAYKYQRFPETPLQYRGARTQQPKVAGPAVDGGQELIQQGQSPSNSIGVGTTDELYALHEEGMPLEGNISTPKTTSSPTTPSTTQHIAPGTGVVLRREKGRNRLLSDNHSSGTDSQEGRIRSSTRGSSDNLSVGSSGSSGDDNKPLKSCLRRHKVSERRCRSMSLSDPFRLFEGFDLPGQKRGSGHRHSYACDGYPLCVDYMYENMDSSQFADMMEWYRATYMPEEVPLSVHHCSCTPPLLPVPIPVIQDSLVLPEKRKSSTAVVENNGNVFVPAEPQGESYTDDGMDKREKRKSVSFASEVSFHSPLPSPQCSPKRQPSPNSGTPQGASGCRTSDGQHLCTQGQPIASQVANTRDCTIPPQGVPVPSVNNGVSDEEIEDSGSDAPPSEFPPPSPRGTTDSQSSDCLIACMETKRVYLSDVSKAAESLVKHFAQSRESFDKLRLGSSVDTPDVGHMVMSQLCPAVARVISDGLKPYLSGLHVFGRIQVTVWRVAEVSAELGPSTRAIHELVKELRNRMDLVSTRQKFEAFIFGLLNLRLLDFWMGYSRHKEKVVGRLYEADSIMCLSQTTLQRAYDEMLISLQPLAILPFQLDYGFIVSYHTGRLTSPPPCITLQSSSEDFGYGQKGHLGVQSSSSHDNLAHGRSESSSMGQSQPTSSKTSWSWLGGSYMSNTLPRAKSMMSKLQKGAVRSLARFSNGPTTTVQGMPTTASHHSFEQCLPRNKGELFQKGHNSTSASRSECESANHVPQNRVIVSNETVFSLQDPQFEGSKHSSLTDSGGMAKFANKIFNIAAGNRQKTAALVYRSGVTEYYFEGDSDVSDSLQSAKTLTGSSDSSLRESGSQSRVRTWKEVKKLPSSNAMPVAPPKPPRSLHMQRMASESSSSSVASTSVSSNSLTSPSKSRASFDLIKLFDKLLLPNEAAAQPPKKPARWSWTPLSTTAAAAESLLPNIDSEHYRSVTTFKTDIPQDSREASSRIQSSNPLLPPTYDQPLNQIQLSDGPILTLPPPSCKKNNFYVAKTSPQKSCSILSNSGCYSGIVQSENLSLTISAELPDEPCGDNVDRNANFVTRASIDSARPPIRSCSAVQHNDLSFASSGQEQTQGQSSSNLQGCSAQGPQQTANQKHRMVRDGSSSSDTDQSKSSSSDQSEMAEPSGSANKIPAETFKLPDFRYVETLLENLHPEKADQLMYAAGEYLEVLAQLDADWLFCAVGNREGLVKCSAVKPLSDNDLFTSLHDDFYR